MCVLLPVLHSGEYYLFESDSEDEEDLQSEEQRPQKHTACQVRHTKVHPSIQFSTSYPEVWLQWQQVQEGRLNMPLPPP